MLRSHFPNCELHIFEQTTPEKRHQILEYSRKYLSKWQPTKFFSSNPPEAQPLTVPTEACPLTNYSSFSSSHTSNSTSGPSPSSESRFLTIPSGNSNDSAPKKHNHSDSKGDLSSEASSELLLSVEHVGHSPSRRRCAVSSHLPSLEQRRKNVLEFVNEIECEQATALELYRAQSAQISTGLPLLVDQAKQLKKVSEARNSIQHKALKSSLVMMYRRATMLFNFMVFHRTVFDVFIAEYDRLLLITHTGFSVRALSTSCEVFETQLDELGKCDAIIQDCQAIVACYADLFENGDMIRGKMMLIARMTDRPQDAALSFRLGFKGGVTLVLFCLSVKAVVFDQLEQMLNPSVLSVAAFKTYRFVFGVMMFVWLWGFNVWIWTHYRVNFVHIFQFDPRTRLTHRDIWSEASNLTIIFFLNLMAYLFCRNHGWEIGDYLFSTGLFLWFLAKGLLPWPFSKWKTRRYFLRRLWNTIIAPWGPCQFADVYVADVLTSMNKLFVDLFTAVCFLLSTPDKRASGVIVGASIKWFVVPIMAGLPFYWRFSQCMGRFWETGDRWPHLANGGKYLTAHTVTIMGGFHTFLSHSTGWSHFRTVWLCVSLLSAAYAYLWDVFMDWGLGRGKGIHFLLRENRSYPTHWYYFALFSNLFLRLSWTITILPFSSNPYWVSDSAYDIWISPTLIFLELFRRFQWGIFRVDCAQTFDADFGNNLNVPLLFCIDETHVPKPSKKPPSILFEITGVFCLFLLLGVVVAR